jgi:hypothetical protein
MRFVAFLMAVFFAISCNSKKEAQPKNTAERSDTMHVQQKESAVNPFASVDISPMDMSYWPVDYPKLKMANDVTGPPVARVIYSRPHLQGRHIFHEVLKYGEPWRLGANESTELDLYRAVRIQNKKVEPGRYVLYCIPQEDHWTIIINTNIDSWGLEPDRAKDLFSFDVPVSSSSNSVEYFTIVFEKTKTGANLVMAWDNVEARLPMEIL